MSKLFHGEWLYKNSEKVTISGGHTTDKVLINVHNSVDDMFEGTIIDVTYQNVINVNFEGNAPFTGVLSEDGGTIYWSNHTKWERASS
ncbi:MAG: hypothetical protein AAF587_29340 [Bacteroidota bacterium]